MYYLNVVFSLVFSVDEDIIQIHNDKDMKFFCKNFINVALEYCQSISQSKKDYLIFKIAVFGLESSLSLIFFANSYPVIGISEVKLDKLPCLSQLIQGLFGQKQ